MWLYFFLYILTSIWNGINCLCLSTWIKLSVYNYLWNFVKSQVLFWFHCNYVLGVFVWRGFDASITKVNPHIRENNEVRVLLPNMPVEFLFIQWNGSTQTKRLCQLWILPIDFNRSCICVMLLKCLWSMHIISSEWKIAQA